MREPMMTAADPHHDEAGASDRKRKSPDCIEALPTAARANWAVSLIGPTAVDSRDFADGTASLAVIAPGGVGLAA